MSGVGEFLHFVGLLEIWIWQDSGGSWGACDVWEGGCDAERLGGVALRGGFVWGNYLVEPKVSSFCIILLNEKVTYMVLAAHHRELDAMTGQMDSAKVTGHG